MMGSFTTLPSPTSAVRVIQVGAGGMGRVWLELLAASPDVELVAVVDLDEQLARRALADLGIENVAVESSISAVLVTRHADAVVNVTVPAAHHPVTTEAMFAGLAVLCEKPIAPTVSAALSLAAAAEASGRLLMVSQSRRYYPALAAFKRLLGELGSVELVSTEYSMAPRFGGFREEMDSPLLLDMSIHAFDAARYLLDANPVSVYCESFNPSWSWYRGDAAASALFQFDGGKRYRYNGSWCSPGFETSWNGNWRASGSLGSAQWDGETMPTIDSDGVTPQADASGAETIAASLAEFIDSLRTGAMPSGEVHSNVYSLAMVEAAVESARTGRRVAIDALLEHAYRTAIADETRSDVLAALTGWGSAASGLSAAP